MKNLQGRLKKIFNKYFGLLKTKLKKIKVRELSGKISSVLELVVIFVMLSTAGLLVLTKFDTPFNVKAFSVLSGSMEPAIGVGSVVFVRPAGSYVEGDVVTYSARRDADRTFTHRIVDVQKDADINNVLYKTKGDANEDPDPDFVEPNRVLGKVLFNIPLFGYIVNFAKTQIGFTFLVIIPATIIVYSEVRNIKTEVAGVLDDRKKKKKKK